MKALLIAAVILLLLILPMFLYLKVWIRYEDEEFSLSLGVLCFRFQLIPRKERKSKKNRSPAKQIKEPTEKTERSVTGHQPAPDGKRDASATGKPQKSAASSKKRTSTAAGEKKEDAKEERDVWETVSMVLELIRAMINPTKFMLRNIRIRELWLRVVVGGEEPDETAIAFGRWNAAVYGGLATLRNFLDIRCRKIMLAVDFTQPETTLAAGGVVRIRIFVLVFAAVRMIWNLLAHTLNKSRKTDLPITA